MELYQCELYMFVISPLLKLFNRKKQSIKPSISSSTKKGQQRELITNKITNHFDQPFFEFKQDGLIMPMLILLIQTPKIYVV